MTVKEAKEALDRLFDYCEEIDNHIPEEERTGYDMLPDIQALRKFISADGEYIKKEDAIRHFQSFEKIMKSMPLADVKARLKDLPTYSLPDSAENKGDTVSRAAYEQTMWERDTAIQQLKDLGYGLGEKPKENEDNTMEWISAKVGKLFPSNDYKCSKCGNILNFDGVNCGRGDANFCPNCGRKAVQK